MVKIIAITFFLVSSITGQSSSLRFKIQNLNQAKILLIIFALLINFTIAGNSCDPKYSNGYDDHTQLYFDPSSYYIAPQFNSFSDCQSGGSCTYSATITADSGQDTSFITFDTTTRKISWNILYSTSQVGQYSVSVTCNYCVSNGNGNGNGNQNCDTGTEKFKLTITQLCTNSTNIELTGPSGQQQNVITQSGSDSQDFSDFKVNKLSGCDSGDIDYTVTYLPVSQSLLSYSISNNRVSWSNPTVSGSYTVTISATVVSSGMTVTPATTTFVLNVSYTCQDDMDEILVLTAPANDALSYAAFAPSSSHSYNTFTLSASLNNCAFSDVTFTKTIVPQTSGLSTSFITVGTTSGNYKTSWSSPTLSQIDVYTITIVASITNGRGTVTASYVFTLTIYQPTCYTSFQSFTFTVGSNNPSAQTYIVRGSQGSFTFNEFTETSDICTTSDIIYEATITPPSGQSHSFITVSSDLKSFTWVTSTPSDAGVYTITLKGLIQTNQFGNKTATSSFQLTVYSCWYNSDTITLSPSETIQPIIMLVNGPVGSYSVLPFTEDSNYCIQDEIAYSYIVTVQQSQSTSFITFQSTSRLISWSSPTEAGIYTIEVTGSITNTLKKNFATTTLVLTVYSCATSIDTITITAVAIAPVVQNVNTEGSSFVVDMYDLVSYACVQTDISYTATISSNELQQTSFITFDHLTRTITWTSPTEAGIYYVNVEGFIVQQSGQIATSTSTFQLTVYSCASSIDEIIITASVLSPVTQNSGTSGSSLVVPEFTLVSGSCFLSDIIYTATIKADSSQSTSFITFSSSSMTILWTTPNYAGVYTVSVLGQVTNTFGLASATATFVLTVIQTATWVPPVVPVVASNTTNSTVSKPSKKVQNSTATSQTQSQTSQVSTIQYKIEIPELTPEQIILPVPSWKQITVSNQGAVTITFSEKFIIPPHLDQMDSTILKIQLLPFGTTDIKYYNYTWNVTEFTNSKFVIQLNFTNPLYISSQGKSYFDKIQVTALEPIFFTSKTSFKSIPKDSTLKKDIPPQLSSNQAANKALGSVTKTLDSASKVASTGSFVANLAMSSSLSLLWGMINAIQIIAHLPYFNMMTPGNAQMFYEFMVNLANFKVLPLDSVYKWLGISQDDEQTTTEQRLLQSGNQTNATNSTVDEAAAKSANLFQNLGPIFLILYLAAFALVLLIILIILQRVKRIKRLTQAILKKIKLMLFWNSTTRYIMESYLNTSLQSFLYIQVTGQDALFSQSNWKSTAYAIFALTICFAAPILINIYLRHKIFKFRNKAFLDKFSSVILTFNWRYCSCANFISIFCYRRLAQVLLIVYFQDYPYAQVQLMNVSCIVVIILFGYSNVYFIPKDRRIEFFNEATILLCLYHFYLFTDFVPDAEARYTMGYSLIVATCFNFGVNVIVMIEATVQKFIIIFKKLKQQYRINKFKKRIQKQNQELLHQINQQNTNHNEEWQHQFDQKHIEMPYVLEEQQLEQQRKIAAQRQKDERALKRKMRRLEAQKEFEQNRLQKEMAQISEVDSEYEVDTKSPKTSKLIYMESQDSIQIKQKRYQNIMRKITQKPNLAPQIGTGSYSQVSQLISEDLEQESKYKSSEQVQNEIYALNRMIESQLQELQDLEKKQ